MSKKSKIPCPLRTKSILWEGAFVINLIKELQNFLKTKMKQVNDPTFGTTGFVPRVTVRENMVAGVKSLNFVQRKVSIGKLSQRLSTAFQDLPMTLFLTPMF